MKRTLKVTLLASAAVLVLGAATPSLAQQDNMRAAGATSQGTYQPARADRNAVLRNDDTTIDGSEAYAYQPLGPSGIDSCATQGSYSQGLDYSACGGGD